MRKRWLSLFMENETGVLARISGLFSGKSYNLDSLTVGVTEDETISRMTIGLTSDDKTFEQIKKQLNRSVEVIKVMDFTDSVIHLKELMFMKISVCTRRDFEEIKKLAKELHASVIDSGQTEAVVESVQSEKENSRIAALFQDRFPDRVEIVRGGSAAIETAARGMD